MIEFDRGWTFSGVERVEVGDVSSRRKLHLTSSKLDAKKIFVLQALFDKISNFLVLWMSIVFSKKKIVICKKIALNLFPGSLVQENRAERKLTEWNLMQQFISHFCGNHPFEICYCYCYNNTNEVKLLEFYPDPFPASSCFSSEIVFLGRNQPRFDADAQFISLLQKCKNNTNENFEF